MAEIFNPQNSEILELNRQRKMADLLTSQGMQTPQGQTVAGGIYVPPNPMEYIAKLFSTYTGTKANEALDAKEVALAQKLRELGVTETRDIINLAKGTPEVSTELAGPAYQGVAPTAVMPGVAGNPQEAMARALMAQSPQAQRLVDPLMKMAMPEPTPEERRYRTAIADGSFKGGFNAFMNQMTDKDKASLANEKIRLGYENQRLGLEGARLGIAQQELAFNTGMGMPGATPSNVGGAFAPKTTPQYEYNPALTGKQNQEQAGKFYETLQKNVTNAKDSYDLMKSASQILASDAPSSGRISNVLTGIGEMAGYSGQKSKADASLTMLSGALTMKQPRFEGPQGVLDVTIYQKLAGDLGNPNIPVASRLSTMKEMVDLQKKYYPNADWSSIKTEIDNAEKVALGAAQKPTLVYDQKTGTFK